MYTGDSTFDDGWQARYRWLCVSGVGRTHVMDGGATASRVTLLFCGVLQQRIHSSRTTEDVPQEARMDLIYKSKKQFYNTI